MRLTRTISLFLLLCAGLAAGAAELNCHGPANVEEFRYTWRLRGGLGWIAGLVFPRNGVGNLKTTYPHDGSGANIDSSLLITAPEGTSGGFYAYESQMDEKGKTLMTYHGYAWGKKARKERTVFDYVKRLARIRKETPEKVEDKVKPLPPEELRDVLTAIYFLRQHAAEIRGPVQTVIYSDGKEYPVIFRPAGTQTFTIENQKTQALGFEIVDAPGGKKWPGGVKLWITSDARRIPLRIEISQSLASMQLDLQSVEACAFMQAAR
ncbi:MAG TPA: DUF3108 domain-containing protein [Thermoanaerobaculia bacterium]|jgi:hypothetical protein|nr:DUF3108 domain-containing protein [Thermoanaerobaculia bacterium]